VALCSATSEIGSRRENRATIPHILTLLGLDPEFVRLNPGEVSAAPMPDYTCKKWLALGVSIGQLRIVGDSEMIGLRGRAELLL